MGRSYSVRTPVAVDVPRENGSAYRLAPGLNEGVPSDVALSWYAKAAGCRIETPAPAVANAKPTRRGRK